MNSNTPDHSGSKAKLIKVRADTKAKESKSVVKINSTPDVVTQGTITVSKDFVDLKKSREGRDTRTNFGKTPETEGLNFDHRSGSHDSDAANVAAILKQKMNTTNVDHIVIDQDDMIEEDDDLTHSDNN